MYCSCTCAYLHAARSEPGSSRGVGVHVWGRCSAGRRLPQTEPAPHDWPLLMSREPNLEAENQTITHKHVSKRYWGTYYYGSVRQPCATMQGFNSTKHISRFHWFTQVPREKKNFSVKSGVFGCSKKTLGPHWHTVSCSCTKAFKSVNTIPHAATHSVMALDEPGQNELISAPPCINTAPIRTLLISNWNKWVSDFVSAFKWHQIITGTQNGRHMGLQMHSADLWKLNIIRCLCCQLP